MMTTEEWNDKPCGGTDQDLTAPEAVERLALEHDAQRHPRSRMDWLDHAKTAATLRALSYAHATALVREQVANAKAMQHLRRAEAAEAALQAADELARALDAYNRAGAGPLTGWQDVQDALATYRARRATGGGA